MRSCQIQNPDGFLLALNLHFLFYEFQGEGNHGQPSADAADKLQAGVYVDDGVERARIDLVDAEARALGQEKLLGVLLNATLRRALTPQDSREWGTKFRWVLWLAAAEKRIPEPCASKHPWDRACMRMLHGMTCSYRHLKATYGIPLPPEVAKIEAAAERARRGRYSEGERKGETAAPAERVWRKPEVLTERERRKRSILTRRGGRPRIHLDPPDPEGEAHPLFWLPGSCDMWTREEYEWMAKRYGGKREERTGKDWDESYEAYFQREDHKWRTMLNRIGI